MSKRFLSAVLLLILTSVLVKAETKSLLEILVSVESNDDDWAVGDANMADKAYGCLQVRQSCVDDVNAYCGTSYRAEDTLGNRALSIWIFQKYIEKCATSQKLGRKPIAQDMARIWNGGPDGWKKESTIAYWVKVQNALLIQDAIKTR